MQRGGICISVKGGTCPFARCALTFTTQDCEDESEDDSMKRERSLLLLASLASEALGAVTIMSKVCFSATF